MSKHLQVKREKIDDFVAIELDLASDVSRHRATAHKLGITLSDKQEHLDCGICMDRSATSVMVPCGHSFCCTPPCQSYVLTKCPVCSKLIEDKMRVVAPVWDQLPRIKIKIDESLTRPVRSKNSKAGKQKSSHSPPFAGVSSSSGEGEGGKGRGLAKNEEAEAAQSQKQRDEKTGVEKTERQLADNALAQRLIKLAHVKVHPNARHFDHSNHVYVCVCVRVCVRVCVCWSCVCVIPTKSQSALWVCVCVSVGMGVCVCVCGWVRVRARTHTHRAHTRTLSRLLTGPRGSN